MKALDVELLGRRHEQDALADSLARLSEAYKNEVTYEDVPLRSKEQDEKYAKELAEAQTAELDKASTSICTVLREVHEASRTQRDFEIIKAGRKQLMHACLNAAAWRYQKLGRQIKAAETGEKI